MNPADNADPTAVVMIRKNLKTGQRELIAPADRALAWEMLGYAIERVCIRALKEELVQGVLPATAADLGRKL